MQIKLTNEEKIVTTEQKPQSREHNSSNVYQEGSMWYFYDAFIFVISDVFPFLKLISICLSVLLFAIVHVRVTPATM